MTSQQEQFYRRAVFHMYLNLTGPESIYKPFYDLLAELGAERVSPDYPIWYFRAKESSQSEFVQRIGAVLQGITPGNDPTGATDVAWRILLMGPGGHNGFSRGPTPLQ